jgi:hypothetical protein
MTRRSCNDAASKETVKLCSRCSPVTANGSSTSEELSNAEAAKVSDLSKTAASNRHIRALKRLKDSLGGLEGVLDM